jgi:cellulose synthase/poly-beta-1,6-N-acetylglucosamine synthase-like glycosyltransferase
VVTLVLTVPAAAVAVALGLFGARRVLLLGASLVPRRALGEDANSLPSLALVVAARDESATIGRLLESLDALDYPPDRLFTVVVDDGSTDSTGEQLARWSRDRDRTRVVTLTHSLGKAAALNAGVAATESSDVIVICDADLRLHRDALRPLAAPFTDASVGAVSGYMRPANAHVSFVSRYAAVETWMTQLVTSAAKDRLRLNPPTLGFCAYRRSAFDQIGGFPAGAVGEDLIATVSLTQRGWQTRFAPRASADNHVVEHLRDYWRQHARWTGNTFDAGRVSGWEKGSVSQRIEVWMMSAGYADRLALLASAFLAAAGSLPLWLPPAYLGLRGIEVCVALLKGGVRRQLPLFLLCTAAFFVADILATVSAMAQCLRRRPATWRSPARAAELPRA